MAYPFGGHPKLSQLVQRLKDLGCKVTELSAEMVGPDGPFKVRYALNPANGKFVVLPNLPDGEHLAASVVGNVERRLDLTTGFASL
jgi:hypothetical protein